MRRMILPITLAALTACRPPTVAHAPAGIVGQPAAAVLPDPGVYVLRRVRSMTLPADLKPKPGEPYSSFDRVLAGWLYLTPDNDYQTVICADMVDSAGRVLPDASDGGLGGEGNKYWLAGGKVYFSDVIADGPVDSTAVRVHGDTVEFVGQIFVRDRTSTLAAAFSRGFPIPAYVCSAVRALPGAARAPG